MLMMMKFLTYTDNYDHVFRKASTSDRYSILIFILQGRRNQRILKTNNSIQRNTGGCMSDVKHNVDQKQINRAKN